MVTATVLLSLPMCIMVTKGVKTERVVHVVSPKSATLARAVLMQGRPGSYLQARVRKALPLYALDKPVCVQSPGM